MLIDEALLRCLKISQTQQICWLDEIRSKADSQDVGVLFASNLRLK